MDPAAKPASEAASLPASSPVGRPLLSPKLAWTLIVALGGLIWWWKPGATAGLKNPEGWRLLAVFLPCVLALILQPLPGGAVVLLALLASILVGAFPLEIAIAGYSNASVWLVLAAYFLARAFINTGLARRIALLFIRWLGHTTLGLGYAIAGANGLLAGMIPSNAARVGGVVLPIVRSLAELYRSQPGASAALIGSYLMATLYQGDVMACALFFTGQASNPLAAEQAKALTLEAVGGPVVLTYANWFWHASVPALVSLTLIPWLVFRLLRPQITHTPEAASFARGELLAMGRLTLREWVLLAIFILTVCGWVFGGAKQVTLVALGAVAALLLTRILTWDDVTSERSAWDVFIWFGGLVQMSLQLKETGLLNHFAAQIASHFASWSWLPLFLLLLVIYFYAHYAFASITMHMVSLYPAFVGVLLLTNAPPALVVCSLAFVTNFSAGLTHYGTTPAPIVFATGYLEVGSWCRVGFWISLVNLLIWLTVGMAWWKFTGLW